MDLKSQLIALGAREPAPEPSAPGLDPWAHLPTPWMTLLRRASADCPPRPSLNAARQLTDKAAKALKNSGRGRESAELVKARDQFLKAREAEAWGLIKARFTELDLPERAYRALKQGEVDPEKVWARLSKQSAEALRPMGADRIRELLMG